MTEPASTPVIADPESGTFCRPGCGNLPAAGSRPAAPRNPKEALELGYRPCRVCRPMDPPLSEFPEPERRAAGALLDDIAGDSRFAVKAGGLLARGLDPDRLARIFRSRFGLSFQDALRMRRVNLEFGVPADSPDAPDDHDVIFTRLETPLGPMLAAATSRGLCLLEFAERRMLETQIKRLGKYHEGRLVMGRRDIFTRLQSELGAYFRGERKVFGLPLDLRGTPFQLRVWEELRRIPWGETRSYGEQARRLGNIAAVRAVARANGDNPVGILVPCHRVLGADGSMTGYGGRIWRKEALLRLESAQGELFP